MGAVISKREPPAQNRRVGTYADQCLFCDKKTITKRGKKELPTKTFTDWSHKSSGWQNIEKMATEMQSHGYSSLLRKVAGVDLFARSGTLSSIVLSQIPQQISIIYRISLIEKCRGNQ